MYEGPHWNMSVILCLCEQVTSVRCWCRWQISAYGTGDCGTGVSCWAVRSFIQQNLYLLALLPKVLAILSTTTTAKFVFSGVASKGSKYLIDDNVSGSETLEEPNGASTISFLSSHKAVAGAPSCLEQSWIPLASETSCHGNDSFWS